MKIRKVISVAISLALGISLVVPAYAAESKFTDVSADAYYAKPVQWAVEKGITSGTSATTFSPDATCTTAQIISFLWRANGSNKTNSANPFSDVSESDYYYDSSAWAYEKGLVSGTQFNGDTPCKRSATVTYFWKLDGKPSVGSSNFTDVPSNAEYAQAVAYAVSKNITAGTSDTTFSPDLTCTRGQIVTFLYRAENPGEQTQSQNQQAQNQQQTESQNEEFSLPIIFPSFGKSGKLYKDMTEEEKAAVIEAGCGGELNIIKDNPRMGITQYGNLASYDTFLN